MMCRTFLSMAFLCLALGQSKVLASLPEVPMELAPGTRLSDKNLTLDSELQNWVQAYIKDKGNPISSLMIADIKTGKILVMAQGRRPDRWGGQSHTALHTGFPAASLFKTIVSAAAFEYGDISATAPIGLVGGCSHVHPTGIWMRDSLRSGPNSMTLRRAYGHSCNSFFAKLAVNHVGLGAILDMSRRFGWEPSTPPQVADFKINALSISPPNAETSSAYVVGRFAAGFGAVGLSPVHALWQTVMLGNDGVPKTLHLFDSASEATDAKPSADIALIQPSTARRIRDIMDATVLGGTASHSMKHPKFRELKREFGGKTGTLTGSNPQGLTTWFTGLYPLQKPEIAVASVVILEKRWVFKASGLAAEAVLAYKNKKQGLALSAPPKYRKHAARPKRRIASR